MATSSVAETAETRKAPPRAALVLLLFLGSGFAGLVYQVLWTRMITYVFGASLYAVAAVLAAFMGGLALGSFLFGRWIDRRRNPLRTYAALEILIGLSALAVPHLLRMADPIFGSIYRNGESGFASLTLMRLVLAIGVLIVPTTLMGATLPVLSKWYGRTQGRLGLSLGSLYAINTFGAVAGCYMTGFHGIEALGVQGMIYVAVAINAGVGLTALALSLHPSARLEAWATEPGALPETPPAMIGDDVNPVTAQLVFWCFGIQGFAALAYEVAWTRSLVFTFDVFKNTTYAFTAMLTVFLIGLAIGSAIMTRFADRLPEPVRAFSVLQLGIGLMGAFSLVVIYRFELSLQLLQPFPQLSEDMTRVYFAGALGNVFVKTAAAILLPTILMGMAYPVAVRVCVRSLARVGRTVGDLYSINTVMGILGSLAAGFFLIPRLGIAWSVFSLSLISIGMSVTLTLNLPRVSPQRRYFLVGLAAATVAILLVFYPFRAVFHFPEEGQLGLYYREGELATVSLTEGVTGERTLYVDGVGVAGTDRVLLTDQKSLAHVPMLFLTSPTVALTVGFGSGGASYSYLQYPMLKRADCVEISPTVVSFSPLLAASNKRFMAPLLDPYGNLTGQKIDRYNLIIDDVRSYLRFTPETYDVIATDCTDLRYKTNANLYDFEYFQLCRNRLKPGGAVVVWMPLAGLAPETFQLALRTFYKVFPEFTIWYMNNEATHYILLIGTERPLRIDYRRMRERLTIPAVKVDLHEIRLDDADKLISCYMTDGKALAKDLDAGPVNSEDRPYLEFLSPLYGYSEQPLYDNLDYLLSRAAPIEPLLAPGTYEPADLERIKKFRAAVPTILEGHKRYRQLRIEDAARLYLRAKEMCPEDQATARLLDFELLQQRAGNRRMALDTWSRYQLGQALLAQNRRDEAISYFKRCLDVANGLALRAMQQGIAAEPERRNDIRRAAEALGRIYQEQGKPRELAELAQVVKQLPLDLGKDVQLPAPATDAPTTATRVSEASGGTQ
jgi:spermidine synthase